MRRGSGWPSWDPKKPLAPFNSAGELQSYPEYTDEAYVRVAPEFREVIPFEETLTIEGTTRGRSSLIFVWRGSDGRRWPMFATDVADATERGLKAEASAAKVRDLIG